MSEPTQQQTAAELDVLRRVNGELKHKSATRKAKIAELETSSAALQAKLHASEASVRELTVNGPVRTMFADISTAPEALQESLSKDYRFELIDGKLAFLTHDGKPVTSKDGKVIPFEQAAIRDFLLTEENEAKRRLYNAILIASKASGGQATYQQKSSRPPVPENEPIHSFGLR